jgi:hypothetical protein
MLRAHACVLCACVLCVAYARETAEGINRQILVGVEIADGAADIFPTLATDPPPLNVHIVRHIVKVSDQHGDLLLRQTLLSHLRCKPACIQHGRDWLPPIAIVSTQSNLNQLAP